MALSYSKYLKIDELLKLQEPLSEGPEHDELLFITIHQVYELWFKEVLHEMDFLQVSLKNNDPTAGLSALKRILVIFKTLVAQVDVLETMTPLSFKAFRSRLESSSGFQSLQFRVLEFKLGNRVPERMNHYSGEERKMIETALNSISVYESFLEFLNVNGYSLSKEAIFQNPKACREENTDVQQVLLQIYRSNPALTNLCERLLDLDEGVQEWRYRHVKMVERTIGRKMGTGGSLGAEYLRTTLFRPLFPDLWAIRSQF